MRHLLLIFMTSLFILSSAHAECEHAKELYEKASSGGVGLEEKISFLEQSVKECEGFPPYYELGKAYAIKGELKSAVYALKKAAAYAETADKKAKTFTAMGRIYKADNKIEDAVRSYKTSLMFSRNKDVEKELMEIEKEQIGSIVLSSSIISTLQKNKNERSIGVVPSIDIRVNFEFDKYTLTELGKKQVEEIGKAMTSSDLSGMKFKLIGHTDSRGTDEYNDRLSLKRAEMVSDYLMKHFDLEDRIVSIEGKGKRELLYHDTTEDAHALNRRVAVEIIENK